MVELYSAFESDEPIEKPQVAGKEDRENALKEANLPHLNTFSENKAKLSKELKSKAHSFGLARGRYLAGKTQKDNLQSLVDLSNRLNDEALKELDGIIGTSSIPDKKIDNRPIENKPLTDEPKKSSSWFWGILGGLGAVVAVGLGIDYMNKRGK